MAVEHYPKNASVKIPIDVVLFSGVTQQTGETANLSVRYVCLDNGQTYDTTGSVFSASPATPAIAVTAFTSYTYDYFHLLDVSGAAWKRGHYRAMFRHSASSREYAFDFTLGLVTQRSLGVAAVYDGSALKASLWVEEFGEVQTDYAALNNVQILDGTGAVISTVGNLTTQTNGIFNFSQTVDLAPVTQYVMAADASIAGYAASNFVFKLRQGLARP